MGLDLKKIKLPIVLVTFILVLLAVLGGQKFLFNQRVLTPLNDSFRAIDGISQVQLTPYRNFVLVEIKLAQDARLQQIVESVAQRASESNVTVKVRIEGAEHPNLNEAYTAMLFPIEEAIVQGNFRVMAELVAEISEQFNMEHQISVDRHYVYLKLAQGDDFSFYVINRGDDAPIQIVAGGGS